MPVIFKEIIAIDNFNPLNVDISDVEAVTNQIPQEGFIDEAMAEKLSTSCLRAADDCGKLLGQSMLYLSHRDGQLKAERANAIQRRLAEKVPSTLAKELSLNDELYIKALSKYNIAAAWHQWLTQKRDILLKTHHLCKDISKSQWTPQGLNSGEKKTGEVGWDE